MERHSNKSNEKLKKILFYISIVLVSSAIFIVHQYLYSTRQIRLVLVVAGIIYFCTGIFIKRYTSFSKIVYIILLSTLFWWLLIALIPPAFDGPAWIWVLDILFMIVPFMLGAFIFNERTKYALSALGVCFLYVTYLYIVPALDFSNQIEYLEVEVPKQFQDMARETNSNEKYIYFLDFWFTNCGYCYKGFKEFQELYDEYKDNPNIKIIAVHNGTGGENEIQRGISKVRELGYDFPIMVDSLGVFSKYNIVTNYPSQILIGKDKIIKFKITGYSYDSNSHKVKQVKKMIGKLLEE